MDPPLIPHLPQRKLVEVVHSEKMTSVLVNGAPFMVMKEDDEACRRLAIVQLAQTGIADHGELSKVFEVHANTVTHYIARYEREGVRGLCEHPRGPRQQGKLIPEIRRLILEMVIREGMAGCEDIRKELEAYGVTVSRERIREVLEENGLKDRERGAERQQGEDGQRDLFSGEGKEVQGELSFGSGAGVGWKEQARCTRGKGPTNQTDATEQKRGKDRILSRGQRHYLDSLEQGQDNAYAGGLLFSTLIERYCFPFIVKNVMDLGTQEGYSVEQMCVTLLYLDLFGYRSIEDYKRAYREEFGVLLGRATAPSPWSLRRFLHRVRKKEVGERLMEEFACEYLRAGVAEWGVLYIDGHFMPYYGMYPIMKGWHAVRQRGMKGNYSFIGVDRQFIPWIFFVRSAQEDLLQKIPELIEKARQCGLKAGIGAERLEKLVVIFDREGYSADLFRLLDGREEGGKRVLFISWAKYSDRWMYDIPPEAFLTTVDLEYEIKKTEQISFYETERMMSRYGKIRTIVIRDGKDNRRAANFTNSESGEVAAEEVVRIICRRWGEENLIKELRSKHMIDYTPGYVRESLHQQPEVDNPRVKELKQKKALLLTEVSRLKIDLADGMIRGMKEKTDAQGVRSSQAVILADIVRRETEIEEVAREIQKLPPKVLYPEAHRGRMLERMNYEKKRVLDCIKIFNFNLEKQMCSLLAHHYGKPKEILPALSMIVRRGGYIKLGGGKLRVMLKRFRDREIDYAARHLCEEVNAMEPVTADRYRFPLYFGVS
jgi:transposase